MPNLYVVSCAAPPAADLPEAVGGFRAAGWTVHVLLTPAAVSFVDLDALAAVAPVRHEARMPGEPKPFPPADAVAVAPLTFNTVNKWAAGISDNTAVGVLHELLGSGVPTVAAVWAKDALRSHPAYARSVEVLAGTGVRFVGAGSGPEPFPWGLIVEALPRPGSGD